MIEIKSRDVQFFEEDFSYKSEVQREIEFYEDEDFGYSTTI